MNYVKRRFNISHVIKLSAQTFERGCKRGIQLGKKPYIDFLILLKENTLHWF